MTTKVGTRYEGRIGTREECLSVIECSPGDIRHLPLRLLDEGLVAVAIKAGARPEDLPAQFRTASR